MSTEASKIGFKGKIFEYDTKPNSPYQNHRYQYSSTSNDIIMNETTGNIKNLMAPAAIFYPTDINDIQTVVKYANSKNIGIAIRSGGHQYVGASSTTHPNIQIDMSETFKNPNVDFVVEDQQYLNTLTSANDQIPVRASVSWGLLDFNKMLGANKLFVPHGQCSHVHVGGHLQTGGYGQLGRSFGLFGDHVISFEIVTADGQLRKVTKESDADLFFAVMGGSPGNFGVLTHFTFNAHCDSNHTHSRGLKLTCSYDKQSLQNLLDVMVEMTNDNLPGDYDYCLTMISSAQPSLKSLFGKNLDQHMDEFHKNIFGKDGIRFYELNPLNMIILYVQYADVAGDGKTYSDKWFQAIKDASKPSLIKFHAFDESQTKPMSQLTPEWVFDNVREFNLPFDKRTYFSPMRYEQLKQKNWSKWVTNRVDAIIKNHTFVRPDDDKLSVQIQNFGGSNSKFFLNRNNGTSYSWRDSAILCILDIFYQDDDEKKRALKWQAKNDSDYKQLFDPQDRRLLGLCHGNTNMTVVYKNYHEEMTYKRLQQIKSRIDPSNIFTANTFSVFADNNILPPHLKNDPTIRPAVLPWNDKDMMMTINSKTERLLSKL